MIQEKKIIEIAEEKLQETGSFIIKVTISKDNRIMVLFDNEKGINISDCKSLSRYIESSLDREKEDFSLEVSSPGLDLPLTFIQQYRKNIGKKVEVTDSEDNKYQGIIKEVEEESFIINEIAKKSKKKSAKLEETGKEIKLSFSNIKETKLIIIV